MQVNRIQNKVAASSLTLPVATVLATLGWLAGGGLGDMRRLAAWLLSLGMVYLLEEMNNRNSLIRVRTRMTAAIYIIMCGCCGFLQTFHAGLLVAPAVLGACYLLFCTYQQYQPVVGTFYLFVSLGLGVLIYPRLIGLVPLFFFCMAAYLRTFTFRTGKAGWLGLLLPFWFVFAVTYYRQESDFWIRMWDSLSSVRLPELADYAALTIGQRVAWGGLSLFSLIAVIRYLHTNYNDKIRTRMFFYVIILLNLFVQLYVVFFPQDFSTLFGLLAACSAPLLAHLYALTRTRFIAIVFVCMIGWLVSLSFLALWIR